MTHYRLAHTEQSKAFILAAFSLVEASAFDRGQIRLARWFTSCAMQQMRFVPDDGWKPGQQT